MKKTINEPGINTVVRHTGWRFEDNCNYPCDVFIIDGKYEVDGRLSNWWKWRRILPDGNLAEVESGYGSFEESENNYDIEIRLTCLSK